MRAHAERRVREFNLTPQQAMALRHLGDAAPMRELADNLGCDASYITGIADSLEARGLVERRPDPADRRVKQLVMTEEGAVLQAQLQARLLEDSPVLAGLSEEERETFHGLLRKLLETGG